MPRRTAANRDRSFHGHSREAENRRVIRFVEEKDRRTAMGYRLMSLPIERRQKLGRDGASFGTREF